MLFYLHVASQRLNDNANAQPQLTVSTRCLSETSFCTDSHCTQQSGEFCSDSDILIFFCLVPFLQFPDVCYITGKKLPTAFCLFDYVAVLFVIVTDRLLLLIPNAILNRILITLAKCP